MAGRLRRTYHKIPLEGNRLSYGGDQSWMKTKRLRSYGCGAVAALDVATYLQTGETHSSQNQYTMMLEEFQKKYIPIIPWVGTLGYFMSIGLNRYFRKNKMAYRAHWGAKPDLIPDRIEEMIKKDIPVIISVGPNTPNPFRGIKMQLYIRKGEEFIPATTVVSHIMVATAIQKDWIQVSSWGKCYYLNLEEYKAYVEFNSNWVGSNIMCIRPR